MGISSVRVAGTRLAVVKGHLPMVKPIKRIGIFAGTFDPVHAGHVTFALQALQAGKLDKVYFLPERRPRNKRGVEHFGHRVAMLRRAAAPHPQFDVLELPDISFSVERTLPRIRRQFANDQLVFLWGSDAITLLPQWPHTDQLLEAAELVIGWRDSHDQVAVMQYINTWPVQPQALIAFASYAPEVSSGRIREALYRRRPAQGLLQSVQRYSDRHWLYVSVA